jgi:diamine N-acetyltransferase
MQHGCVNATIPAPALHYNQVMKLDPKEASVTLKEITADSVRAVCELKPHPAQERFVAPNAVSIAQAYFHQEAWFRAIHADDELVGFVMLEDWTRFPAEQAQHLWRGAPYVSLWRFMVDARHQRRGIGRAALELIINKVRAEDIATWLLLSYVPGEGCPEPLYRSLGFTPTGDMEGQEVVMSLPIKEPI